MVIGGRWPWWPRRSEDSHPARADGAGTNDSADGDEGTEGKWPWRLLAGIVCLLALVAVFTSSPGWYVTDNRFEQFWAPGRVLARFPVLWDPSRSLGGPRGELTLLYSGALALVRGLGAGPAVAERLCHAALITTGGLGMVAFLRVFRPRFGPEHAVAGLFYAFNPFSAVFLIPSGLYLRYALAPWMLVAVIKGVTGDRPWRWAAVFALLVGASGTLDPPGLVYTLVLVIPVALYLVAVERRCRWASVLAWSARAGALALVVSAGALVQVVYASASLSARLFGTESVDAIHATSSWSESWRGMGFWPSYFPEGGGLLRPQHAAYLDHAVVVLATFVPAAVAVTVLGWSRWKPRVLLAGLALVSLVLMVGPFPTGAPPPIGQILLELYGRVPSLTALRTSYKAGAGLAIGVAGLLGMAAATVSVRRRRAGRVLAPAAALALIGVVSFPFWTARTYAPEDRMGQVPTYWREALRWLDAQPDASRALVLPGTSNTRYRWGSPGDDILDALLDRPHLVYTSLPASTPVAFDLERAIDEHVTSGDYQRGTLAPVVRRLGVGWVLVRNDLEWEHIGRARPDALAGVRDDPDLERVASFGSPGQNVVAPGDDSLASSREAALPPVEIYRVKAAGGPARAVAAGRPTVVSGAGDAWFELAGRGLLDIGGPLRYSASMGDDELAGALGRGAPLVVTDTNRRRESLVTRFGDISSHTLSEGEDLGRPAPDLFARAGSQSVAAFPDAVAITSDPSPTSEVGSEGGEAASGSRPANAFDGDPASSWLTGALGDPRGRKLHVTFDGAATVSSVEIGAAPGGPGGRAVTAASLGFSDGSWLPVDLTTGRASVRLASPRQTTTLELRIDALAGPGQAPVGFSEVAVGGLDLAERIQLPDDVFRAAQRDARVAESLGVAPVRYLLQPLPGEVPEGRSWRRRLRTWGTRPYLLTGELAPSGRAEPGGPAAGPDGGCRSGVVSVDGQDVPVRVGGTGGGPGAGSGLAFWSCSPLHLGPGWHGVDTSAPEAVSRLALATTDRRPAPTPGQPPQIQARTGDPRKGLSFQVRGPEGGMLIAGMAYDPNWSASAGGRDLGPPREVDAQSAWVLPAGDHQVDLRYRPQRLYESAMAITWSGLALCAWLVARKQRR